MLHLPHAIVLKYRAGHVNNPSIYPRTNPPFHNLPVNPNAIRAKHLLELLLWAELVGVSALLLSAVGSTGRETGVALSADHLFAVELGGKGLERWLDDTTTETEDQVEGRFLLDVVI